MLKFLSFFLLCVIRGQYFDFKMRQVSVWIEHRYATTEIGIWLVNNNTDLIEVNLEYNLKLSDFIHGLHGKYYIIILSVISTFYGEKYSF